MSLQETGALAQFGISEAEVAHALGRVKVRDVDYADLYFEYCQTDSVSMEEGLVKRATKNVGQGVGVRAIAGEKTGFAYSDELTKQDLEIAADTARYIADSPQGDGLIAVTHRTPPARDLPPGPATGRPDQRREACFSSRAPASASRWRRVSRPS